MAFAIGQVRVVDDEFDGTALARAGAQAWGFPTQWVGSVDFAEQSVTDVPAGGLWMVRWEAARRTAFHLLHALDCRPVVVYTSSRRILAESRIPFLLKYEPALWHGALARDWTITIQEVARAPWVSTGRSLSQALVRFVPDDELWAGLTQEDHEFLLCLALEGRRNLGRLAAELGMPVWRMEDRCAQICRKLGVESVKDLRETYRRLAGWLPAGNGGRQRRRTPRQARAG